jgi:hypothetical protein
VAYLKQNLPPECESEAERHNRGSYLELINRLEGFLEPRNRLNGLKARIDTSEAVIGQYSKNKKKTVARGVTVAVADESTSALTEASKRYVTTRLNVDQARRTEADLPGEFLDTLEKRRAEMQELVGRADDKTLVEVFLSELIRTYSGVWGVRRVHDVGIFETVEKFAIQVSTRPDRHEIIGEVLDAPPREVYEIFSTRSGEEAVGFFARD